MLNIREIMVNAVHVIGLDETIGDAAQKMWDAEVGCMVVVDGVTVIGIISERDMVLGCLIDGHNSWECQVFRHMTIQEVTAHPDTEAGDAAILMLDGDADYLPVVEGHRVVGMIGAGDIAKAVNEDMSRERPAASMSH